MRRLQEIKPKFFRWHVGGDIPHPTYYNRMKWIAAEFPKVAFLCFTKRHSETELYDFRTAPNNLRIVASMWPGWGRASNYLPMAWVQDGTETRVPKNAIPCPGKCEHCFMCWKMKANDNVVFTKKKGKRRKT